MCLLLYFRKIPSLMVFFWRLDLIGCLNWRRIRWRFCNKNKWVRVGENGEAWKWRMRLFVWEEELEGECFERLTSIVLHVEVEDRCVWNLHPYLCYTINNAYKNLTEVDNINHQANSQILWLKIVPLNISIFVWRLLLNRILTNNNLAMRQILATNEQRCVSNCGLDEDKIIYL